jgi:peptidoglycan/LPS O-acetylase OafA/YrhL
VIRFRGDVEGLRAVAVLLVLFDHLGIPGFPGGFIGVDVFFVISGYLITSLLAAEYARKAEERAGRGSISIPGFYARRARRILPAALTVIVAVVVAGGILLNDLRSAQIHHDAVWAALFGSNVNFIRQATDYFTEGMAATSPFQHYWSLAVEEQFYLVWPALFLLVARLHGLRLFGLRIRWRARLGVTVCCLGAASFAWSVTTTASTPAAAYFSTFTRAWELALGALIGLATTGATRLPRRLAATASAAGVALFVVACAVIDSSTPFPGAAALLPTLAAALLIVGGLSDAPPLANRVLCIPPLRFLGRISYSIYLWHWPFVVFAAALYPTMSKTIQMRLLILIITFAVSTLSFYLVEQPGRRIGSRPRRARTPGRNRWRPGSLGTAAFGTCVLAAVFVGLFSAIGPEGSTASPVAAGATARSGVPPAPVVMTNAGSAPSDQSYVRTIRDWQQEIRAGLGLRLLPASLRPLSPHLSLAFPPPCIRGLAGTSPNECVVGNPAAAHVAVLNGDSHAEMLRNAVWRAFDSKTWSIHIFERNGCGWAGAANGTVSASGCRRLQEESQKRIRALHPDVLLLSEHLVVTPFRSASDIASSLASFRNSAGKTIVLGHTPLPQPWRTCLVGAADMSRCFVTLDDTYRAAVRLEQRLATRAGATFVDTSSWFCVRTGGKDVCPPVIDGVPAFKDETHVAAEYQFRLIPVVRALLRSAGVSPSGRALQAEETVPSSGDTSAGGYSAALGSWRLTVRAGLRVATLPSSLRPLRPHLVDYVEPYCNPKVRGLVAGECAVGSVRSKHVAVLTGDSHAGMFRVAVSRGLGRTSWRVHVFQRAHCGWAGSVGPGVPVSPGQCVADQAATLARIRALHPEILVLSQADFVMPYRSEADMAAALSRFAPLADRIVVLGHTPTAPSFDSCLRGSADISRCTGAVPASYHAESARERALVKAAGAMFVDTSEWFCVDVGGRSLCPAVIDGAPVWRDGTHLTSDIERKLVPLLGSMLHSSPPTGSAPAGR